MSVFYSGWGYWEYDCMDSFDGETMRETIDKGSFIKVCNVFELPEDAEREIEFLGETTVSYLLECIRSDGKGIRFVEYHTQPIDEPRFILCDERKGEQRFNIDNRPIIEKTKTYTKDEIIESQARDDAPINETETERNIILMQPAYLDQTHPMFSEELNIAIKAWNEVLECNPEKPKKGSRKKLIEDWLETNHKTLPMEAKKRIATLLNPDKNGGAPSSN
ncbi:hypothetical protein B0F88_110179 [Methylobacter tundripaludum]|uniref:Uncharacterized protein n=1 Tax=Methylobacter tundripaludum TaxID=173365 RepID=A0A2S6GVX2_9GAMM|nr:hypothetical protein [Methylobacter tundripaludum]PPK69392.1 hypothetical protein B0F88_110179 [Methylobacter tundripaludum]